jgi:hypothetical protein
VSPLPSCAVVAQSAPRRLPQGLFFLLGPYVGVCIARWWQMRTEFLGGVWGAVADLNMYAALWFNSGSVADRDARALVQRYGLLCHLLLYKDARGQTSLDDAVDKGLLLPHEAAILTSLPSRTQMVFSWLSEFWAKALSESGHEVLGTSKVPHAANQAPIVLKRCLDGRGAAGGALALVYTQLPFPYVHLLSLLVQIACTINATVMGAHTGWLLSEPICTSEGAVVPTAHRHRYEIVPDCPPAAFVYSWTANCVVIAGLLISVIIYPIIYHGLLSIGIMLSTPLGPDFIDFPGSFYQHIMKAEFKGFYTCIDAVNLKGGGTRWWRSIVR